MNRIYILPEEIEGEVCVIEEGLRVNHIIKILRAIQGDFLKVVVVDKGLGEWKLTELTSKRAVFEVGDLVRGIERNIHLTIGLCRPPTAKKILEHGTSLGVKSFTFFQSALNEKSYSTSRVYTAIEYSQLLYLGLAQSTVYEMLPKVSVSNERSFDSLIREDCYNVLLSKTGKSRKDVSIDITKDINLIVGPERGFTEAEELFFEEHAAKIQISKSVLRTEIAIFSALGQFEI